MYTVDCETTLTSQLSRQTLDMLDLSFPTSLDGFTRSICTSLSRTPDPAEHLGGLTLMLPFDSRNLVTVSQPALSAVMCV